MKPVVKTEISDEEVQKQIKDTLARLTSKGSKFKTAKHRRDKREAVSARLSEEMERQEQEKNVLKVTEFVTVSELATMMDVSVTDVITACMNLGLMVSINQRLDAEALVVVAEEFGFKVEFVAVEIQEAIDTEEDSEEDLVPRPPVVAVMGHVDHGKTSLLDNIRNANVIAGEAGGITQHIGAYSVKLDDGRRITFLDTPGHEAFTAMRARGAKVTDVAIIIVAADDNVMPQTVEAINHATAAGVPMVFAINKIDKPGANPEKIKEELSAMNYLVEDWGGKYQSQEISAKKGINLDKLLDKVLLEAEFLDLKANPNRKARGVIIEAKLDHSRGAVATALVQNGTLHVGDMVVAGNAFGRIRAMVSSRGERVKHATPSTPVEIIGFGGVPEAGDEFMAVADEKLARQVVEERAAKARASMVKNSSASTLEELYSKLEQGEVKDLNIIIKADVQGSVEAVKQSLEKLSNAEVRVRTIHSGVGAITENDVMLAGIDGAIIIGFNVRPDAKARDAANRDGIDIRYYRVIYQAIEDIEKAMKGMLTPEFRENVIGHAEVRNVFKITGVGIVAGSYVTDGKLQRNAQVRLLRDNVVVYEGKLSSLQRFKDAVKEVADGYECGVCLENYTDIKEGDVIECFVMEEIPR